jgi:hypothetical protein
MADARNGQDHRLHVGFDIDITRRLDYYIYIPAINEDSAEALSMPLSSFGHDCS